MSGHPSAALQVQEILPAFFEQYSVQQWRYLLWRWFGAVLASQPYCLLGSPGQLLGIHAGMLRLITMADAAHQQLGATQRQAHPALAPTPPHEADRLLMLGLSRLYQSHHGQVLYLYEAEVQQPHLFFCRLFAARDAAGWRCLLDEWLEIGLDKMGIADYQPDLGQLPAALELLMGLCEASWLLHRQQGR